MAEEEYISTLIIMTLHCTAVTSLVTVPVAVMEDMEVEEDCL